LVKDLEEPEILYLLDEIPQAFWKSKDVKYEDVGRIRYNSSQFLRGSVYKRPLLYFPRNRRVGKHSNNHQHPGFR
jgi:hypothetical protein